MTREDEKVLHNIHQGLSIIHANWALFRNRYILEIFIRYVRIHLFQQNISCMKLSYPVSWIAPQLHHENHRSYAFSSVQYIKSGFYFEYFYFLIPIGINLYILQLQRSKHGGSLNQHWINLVTWSPWNLSGSFQKSTSSECKLKPL